MRKLDNQSRKPTSTVEELTAMLSTRRIDSSFTNMSCKMFVIAWNVWFISETSQKNFLLNVIADLPHTAILHKISLQTIKMLEAVCIVWNDTIQYLTQRVHLSVHKLFNSCNRRWLVSRTCDGWCQHYQPCYLFSVSNSVWFSSTSVARQHGSVKIKNPAPISLRYCSQI